MTTLLYLTPLPEIDGTTAQDSVAANISAQGLLQEGGVATERIATDSVGGEITGRFNPGGRVFAEKFAAELQSLGKSTYASIPLYDPDADNDGPDRGYYEVSNVEVNPAQPGLRQEFEYTASLSQTGTRNSHYRAVRTNAEGIGTGLATGSGGLVGIPAAATKTQWFDVSTGTEEATPTQTVSAEYGGVDLFDPTDASTSDPTLLFELPYSQEGNVDVRVWDTRGRSKFYTFDDGTGTTGAQVGSTTVGSATVGGGDDDATTEITQWTHAYHDGFEFDGDPVVDNGLLRLRFNEAIGKIYPSKYDERSDEWVDVGLYHGGLELIDADITLIGPAEVEVICLFDDNGTRSRAVLSIQRGIDGVIVRDPENGSVTSAVESLLAPVASDQTTDPQPAQRLRARSEV